MQNVNVSLPFLLRIAPPFALKCRHAGCGANKPAQALGAARPFAGLCASVLGRRYINCEDRCKFLMCKIAFST